MSPCCKAVKDDSRKHTVNLFLIAVSEDCRTNSEQGGNTVPKILKRELYGNFLAFAKGYQFSSKMCQRLRDCHSIIRTIVPYFNKSCSVPVICTYLNIITTNIIIHELNWQLIQIFQHTT